MMQAIGIVNRQRLIETIGQLRGTGAPEAADVGSCFLAAAAA
jgi:hypothetical protein